MNEVHSRAAGEPFNAMDWARDNARLAAAERLANRPPLKPPSRRFRFRRWHEALRWRLLDAWISAGHCLMRLPRDDG